MSGLSLGIDAGSSSARWQMLGENGQGIGSGRVGPVSAIDLLRESEAGATTANLRELLSQASAAGRPTRVVAGVTGLGDSAEDVLAMRTTLASGLGIDVAAVTVLPDVYIAYLSAFEPGGGVLVYAGTGSIALHLTSRGEALRAGGHGYLLDDAGGAYWIGREALKLVLRRSDEAGAKVNGRLASALYASLGGDTWPHIRHAVYQGGRSKVATLARAVSLAANRGDPDAQAVLAAAGRELARLANVLVGRLGQVLPVAFAGGVTSAGAHLTDALAAGLSHGTRLTLPTSTPVEAAATLAARLAAGTSKLPDLWR
ncbi:MAG: hypothetical protein KF813_11950 [Trueperaceae bacterium]|nr:hypothetical protein [Trueperaceae bacterium]